MIIALGLLVDNAVQISNESRRLQEEGLSPEQAGIQGAKQLATYWVGQGVGLMNDVQDTRSVVREFMEDRSDLPPRLMGKLLQAADPLFHAARIVDASRTP